MEFRLRGSKSMRGSPPSTRTEIRRKCLPSGLLTIAKPPAKPECYDLKITEVLRQQLFYHL